MEPVTSNNLHPVEQIQASKHTHYKPSKILFIPFFLIIVGISIVIGKFWYSLHPVSEANNMPLSASYSINHGANTISPKPATQKPGWKLYQDTAGQFSFSYPPSLQIKEKSYGLGVTSISLSNSDSPQNPQFQMITFPMQIGNLIGQNFNNYYIMKNGTSAIVQSPQQSQSSEQITKIQNTTVDGLKAVEISATAYPVNPKATPNIGRYIQVGNNMFIILTSPVNQPTLDAILASFQYPAE